MKIGKASRQRLWYMVKQRLKMIHRAKIDYVFIIGFALLITCGVVVLAVCTKVSLELDYAQGSLWFTLLTTMTILSG